MRETFVPAAEHYELRRVRLPLYRRVLNWALTLAVAANEVPTFPAWSAKGEIVDKDTQQVVRLVTNTTGQSNDNVLEAETDLGRLEVDEFQRKWGLE